MCVYSLSNKIYINIISHQYKKINNKIVKDLAVIGKKTFSQFDYYHKPILYDTGDDNNKLLCAIKDKILCHILKFDVDFHILGLYFSYTINIENIFSYSATLLMNKDNCYFIEFNSEYLFCCANGDKISCQRKNKNLELINKFEINPQLPGNKYNLTIENNEDHAILKFINEKDKNIYLYKYYIYLPECGDSIKEVENFENVELELFKRRTNTKYYIKFTNLQSINGIIKKNNREINRDNAEVIENSDRIFFESSNQDNKQINYEILIEETYSQICTIQLIQKACYPSCLDCSEGIAKSTDDHHNCINCKDDYYPFALDITSCYKLDEIGTDNKNFYFNSTDKILYPCYENCRTCYGPNEDNCLSCKLGENNNLLYLYNDKCISNCPKGTFKKQINETHIYCVDCYENCESCEDEGNSDNMLCLSCNSSYIKNEQNCYKIADDNIKSFFDPNNNDEILNCSSFNKYIIENTYECININISIGEIYILNYDTGLIRKCHPNCLNCSISPKYDEYKNTIDQNCTECISDYNFEFGTYNCYNDSIIEKGYYLSDDSMYHKCDIKCKTCQNDSTPEQPNCLLCNNGEGYYKISDKQDFNCYNNKSDIIKNYFLEEIYEYKDGNNETIITFQWSSCYQTCETCSDKGDFNYHNCDSCISNHFKIEDTKNCIDEEYALNNSFYLEKELYLYKQCDIGCKKCIKENTNGNIICIECDINKEYYNIEGDKNNCYNYESLPELDYYLDKNDNIWKKCYEFCEECNSEGNNQIMNCISCKTDLINNKTNNIFYFELNNGNCIEACPNNTLITPIGDCVMECPENLYEYSINNSCIENCPNNYEANEVDNKCIFKGFDKTTKAKEFKNEIKNKIPSYVNSSSIINGSDFLAIVLSSDDITPEKQLKLGISAVDLGNCIQTIKQYYNMSNNESFIIFNMETKRDKNQEKNNSENRYDLGKNTEISIYDFSGKELNLSVCKEDIKIMKYLADVEELDIETAKTLANQGIDVFNAQDDFFNDLCHKFDNVDGKDIILTDRRKDIYKNVSFCQDGCYYSGINYEFMSADCLCDSNFLQGEEKIIPEDNKELKQNEVVNFKSISKSFISSIFDFNYEVLRCYNLVLYKKNLIGNIGFYSISFLFFIQIIFLFIYLIKKLNPIKNFMLSFKKKNNNNNAKSHPPNNNYTDSINKQNTLNSNQNNNIKTSNINKPNKRKRYKKSKFNRDNKLKVSDNISLRSNSSNKLTNSNRIINFQDYEANNEYNFKLPQFSKFKEKDSKVLVSNNFGPIINIQTPCINFTNKENKIDSGLKQSQLISDINNNKIKNKKRINDIISKCKDNKDIHKYKSKKKDILQNSRNFNKKNIDKLNTTGEQNINKNKLKILNGKSMKFKYSDSDLQDMDYEEAIIYDKRSCFGMYWAFLVDTQIILETFCTENYLHLFVIKLSFFVCSFQMNLFLNALFYTDEYISDAYHNNGVLDFVSGLPKSIYSFIATLVITNLLKILSNCRSELAKIIREKGKNENYINLINIKLAKLRKKLIAYFILIFFLGLFFLYYVTCFCAVYKYSQKYWFFGCLESFGMDSLMSVCICIILSLFRFISIKNNIKCFYKLADIIGTFL